MKIGSCATLLAFALLSAACATAPKSQPKVNDELQGVASWYGQEYAGRTTANGEIFDPLLFTAAHRTLPFGTVVDVQNTKSQQSVRVRINDRGPYIGSRMIDLSYAAAQQIGLVEPGSGDVVLKIVKVGSGDREPPAPYVVTVPDVTPLPLPEVKPATEVPSTVPVVVDQVKVVEERQGVETRLQVSRDGKKLEEVPVKPAPATATVPAPPPKPRPVSSAPVSKFVVQVGAFAQEANAKRLMTQLTQIGQSAHIENGSSLYLVRIGPFDTRDQAIQARAKLETAGLSAIVMAQ